jgi:ammonium transporter, Amt family
MPALLIGFIAGIVCYYMVVKVKGMLGYDDSLDAFGVHGAGGTLGAILTGVFATMEVNALKDASGNPIPTGLLEGNSGQLVNQLIGCAIAWGIAIVGSFIILKVVDAVTGLRVSAEEETVGLDLSQHGEEGYNLDA